MVQPAGIVYPGKHSAHHLHFVTEYKDNEPNTFNIF